MACKSGVQRRSGHHQTMPYPLARATAKALPVTGTPPPVAPKRTVFARAARRHRRGPSRHACPNRQVVPPSQHEGVKVGGAGQSLAFPKNPSPKSQKQRDLCGLPEKGIVQFHDSPSCGNILPVCTPSRRAGLFPVCHTTGGSLFQSTPPPLVKATQKSQINTVPTPTVAWTRP